MKDWRGFEDLKDCHHGGDLGANKGGKITIFVVELTCSDNTLTINLRMSGVSLKIHWSRS